MPIVLPDMDANKTKSGIKQPHTKNSITAKVAEEFRLTEEPAGEIDFSNHHCIYRERLKTALASCKKPHVDEGAQGVEALMESLRVSSALTNKSPNPIMRINPDTSIAYVNSALEKLTGHSYDELIGLKIPYPWWTKSNLKKIEKNFEKALGKGVNKVEQLFINKNGELFWVEITTTIVEKNGQFQYCLSNWVDITERKQAVEALKNTTLNLQERLKELKCFHEVSMLKDVPNKTLNEFLQDVVSLIPPVGQHPELTCARITFEGNEFRTDNFKKTEHKLTADIKITGKSAGIVEVCNLGNIPENNIDPFLDEERMLVDAIAREIGKYAARVRAEETLKNTYELLVTEQVAIRGKNVALKEVLNQIELEKKQTASSIQSNINKIIMPILRKLQDKANSDEKHYILLLQNSLEEIASPFINKLESTYSELLPREVQICNMIKNGMTTKEIASNLEISIETIRSQRKNIRKKLGIANNKVLLTAFLNQS